MAPGDEKVNTFLRMIRRSQRGRLKVYLGYCAGVGKTYQMLLEGHRLKSDGIDVVVGLVETHGRAETAKLLEGLDVIPRTKQEYRGVTVEEMDVDAILARKPAVALIDELAHTNVPGSRNPKRYEDVQDILAAGIHVISTLNVQHIESLYNTVETMVGVKVRERIPDSVLAEADQLVNVDLTTEDLRRRIEEGKVYPNDRIQTSLANFFTPSHLEQLREVTLRELASQIDLRRREPIEEEMNIAPDQVLACLSSRGPNSEMMLRYASRLAGRLNRNWYALYVQTPSEEPTAIDAQTQGALASALTLAKQLGAMVFTYKGEDVVDAVLRFAREYRVGHVVMGRPTPLSFWQRLIGRRDILTRLLEKGEAITFVVLDTQKGEVAATYAPIENKPPSASPKALPSIPPLASLLSPEHIVVWDEPVLKEEVVNTLARAALEGAEKGRLAEISRKIWERELLGSTFFNEGVGFPHARIAGLENPLLALGLTQCGIVDVATEKPVEIVFLILSPEQSPNAQLQILALTNKAAQNRYLQQRLKSAKTPAQAMAAIVEWESRLRESANT